jgi:O-antigen/teichoic acid export membrane protein
MTKLKSSPAQGSHSRRLFVGSSLNTVNLIVSVFSGLLVTPWMMHAYGDSNFGIWSLIASFMGYYGLLDLGLSSAISRFVSRAIGQKNHHQINEVVTTGFFVLVGISIVSVLATLGLMWGSHLLFKEAGEIQLFNQLLIILSVNIVFGFPCYVFDGILTSHLRFDLLTIVRLLSTLIRTVLTYYFIRWNYDITSVAILTVVLTLLENGAKIIMSYKVNSGLKISWACFRPSQIREMFSYSMYTFIAKVADLLRFQIVSVVLTAFINVAAVTHYRVASRLIEYFMQLIVGITTVFTPYFSQKEGEDGSSHSEEIRDKFISATRVTAYVSLFVGYALIFYGKDFIIRWVGKDYGGSYNVLVVLTIPIALALTQSTTAALLYGISRHKFISYSNIAEGIANFILSLLLVKPFGMMGVAWSMAIPLFVSKVFLQPWYVSRILKVSFFSYVWVLTKPLIVSMGAFGLPALLFSSHLSPNFRVLFSLGFIHLLIYMGIVSFAGLLPTERSRIFNLINKKRVA